MAARSSPLGRRALGERKSAIWCFPARLGAGQPYRVLGDVHWRVVAGTEIHGREFFISMVSGLMGSCPRPVSGWDLEAPGCVPLYLVTGSRIGSKRPGLMHANSPNSMHGSASAVPRGYIVLVWVANKKKQKIDICKQMYTSHKITVKPSQFG